MNKLFCLFLAVLVLHVFVGGCSSTGSDAYFRNAGSNANIFVAQDAKVVKKLAVMPFKAETELAGISVSDMFITELLRTDRFELVERSRMSQVLNEAELTFSGMTAGKAAEIGKMLGADAVLTGTVDEYGMKAVGGRTYAVAGVSARIISCSDSRIIASMDISRMAGSASLPLSQHARTVVHELMASLYREWR